jgi:hypothetical protein
VEEAVDRIPSSYLEASIHLPKAIEALRRIGGSQERVDEPHKRLLTDIGQSLTEMASASAEFDAKGAYRESDSTHQGRLLW